MEILNLQSPQVKQILGSLDQVETNLENLRLALTKKQWLTPKEVCEILKISQRTLLGYREEHGLPYSRIGDKIFFSNEDLEGFLFKHRRNLF